MVLTSGIIWLTIQQTVEYLDYLENGGSSIIPQDLLEKLFGWAKGKEDERHYYPTIITYVTTGNCNTERDRATCYIDGIIKLFAERGWTGEISVDYGVCLSTSPTPSVNDNVKYFTARIDGTYISTTAALPCGFTYSGLKLNTKYYYRAFVRHNHTGHIEYVSETKSFITNERYVYVSTVTQPRTGGTIDGAGAYPEGTVVTLTATSNPRYDFSHWDNDITTNTRSLTVDRDTTVYAYFKLKLGRWRLIGSSFVPDFTFVPEIIIDFDLAWDGVSSVIELPSTTVTTPPEPNCFCCDVTCRNYGTFNVQSRKLEYYSEMHCSEGGRLRHIFKYEVYLNENFTYGHIGATVIENHSGDYEYALIVENMN